MRRDKKNKVSTRPKITGERIEVIPGVAVVSISPDELEVAKVREDERSNASPLGSGEREGAGAASVVPTLLLVSPAAEGMGIVVVGDTGPVSIVSLVEIDISLGPPLDVVVISRGFSPVVSTLSGDERVEIGSSRGSVEVKVKVGVEIVVAGVPEVRGTSAWSVVAAKGMSDVKITGLRTSSPSVDSASDERVGIGSSGGSVGVKVKVGVGVVVADVSEVRSTSAWSVVAAKGTSDVKITGLGTSSPLVDSVPTTPSGSFP